MTAALMFGAMWGLVLAICGIYFTNWRFWVLLLAACLTLAVGEGP